MMKTTENELGAREALFFVGPSTQDLEFLLSTLQDALSKEF